MFLVQGVILTYTARPATVWRAVVVPTFKEYMLVSSLMLHRLFDWVSRLVYIWLVSNWDIKTTCSIRAPYCVCISMGASIDSKETI